MNTHLLIILAELVALTGLFILFAFYGATPARAQSGTATVPVMPPPPAYTIALRLLMQGDNKHAVAKLHEVENSATYQNTAYAPEATYLIARIYRDNLHDNVHRHAAGR